MFLKIRVGFFFFLVGAGGSGEGFISTHTQWAHSINSQQKKEVLITKVINTYKILKTHRKPSYSHLLFLLWVTTRGGFLHLLPGLCLCTTLKKSPWGWREGGWQPEAPNSIVYKDSLFSWKANEMNRRELLSIILKQSTPRYVRSFQEYRTHICHKGEFVEHP